MAVKSYDINVFQTVGQQTVHRIRDEGTSILSHVKPCRRQCNGLAEGSERNQGNLDVHQRAIKRGKEEQITKINIEKKERVRRKRIKTP